jgi:hypothetical protein
MEKDKKLPYRDSSGEYRSIGRATDFPKHPPVEGAGPGFSGSPDSQNVDGIISTPFSE